MKDFVVIRSSEASKQDFEWGMLYWYANAQAGNSEEMTVGKCVIRPGCRNPGHSHPNCEEVLHLLRGRIRHYVQGGESFEMGPGDTISIRPNVSHYAENVGDEPAEMMIAFSTADRQTRGE